MRQGQMMEMNMTSNTRLINTDEFSTHLRAKGVNLEQKQILITNFCNTEQQEDLSEPPNCNGFGRIRHFSRATSKGWPPNPLPIDPACKALNIPSGDTLRAQVFQNAVCNWRCWYCYVPFDLLSANHNYSNWLSPSSLVDLYLDQSDPPLIIDLTGGQPDLVPEWVPWIMDELDARGLSAKVYLWSDDNLSNDYFWKYLSDEQRGKIACQRNYGRVCCFKGFNADSFSFNTLADPALFDRQFELMRRLVSTGIDLYGYITITTPAQEHISDDMRKFFDRIQDIDENLPLRIVPLEVQEFTPLIERLNGEKRDSLKNQWIAVESWQKEIEARFNREQRNLNISDVLLHSRK
jgi:uncharacterized Fe-S cluster-containing radical SAM superfamily protein